MEQIIQHLSDEVLGAQPSEDAADQEVSWGRDHRKQIWLIPVRIILE